MDILIESSGQNVARLLSALSNYGEGYAKELTPEDFDDAEGAIRIVEESEMSQIHIFTRMTGLRYEDLAKDSNSINLAGHKISFASKAALIRLKEASLREKDQIDVLALKRLQDDPHAFD